MSISSFFQKLLLLLSVCCVYSATPNSIVSIDGAPNEWLVKRALFGSEDTIRGKLVHAPSQDELLCNYYNDTNTIVPIVPDEDWIMMVPRGVCEFERKAYAAKVLYGAKGILVYDNLSARYRWNSETDEMQRWPQDEVDYECSFGYGSVYNIGLDPPPYSREIHDPILDMKSPLSNCTLEQTREPCESQLCLVTGPAVMEGDDMKYPVCCAWDTPVTMGEDESAGNTDDVVAVFLTIRQGQDIFQYVGDTVVVEPRPYSYFNGSQIFLWLLGVSITWTACYFSSSDMRVFRAKLARYQDTKKIFEAEQPQAPPQKIEGKESGKRPSVDTADIEDLVLGIDDLESDDDDDSNADIENSKEEFVDDEPVPSAEPKSKKVAATKQKESWSLHSLPPKGKELDKGKVWTLYSLPPPERKKTKARKKKQRPGYKEEVTMETSVLPSDGGGEPIREPWATPIGGFEMTQWHVLGFVVFASLMLFMLFYFEFYSVIFVLYGFGCAGSISHLIFGPALTRLVPKIPSIGREIVAELNKKVVCGLNGFDITSQLLGYVWAILWIWYGLSHYRPSTNAFFWITINVFGACFCILALSMMKLGSIKIATMLLVAVFVYDIFFVFITPLFLDGESIMITVAKGGGGQTQVDDFCIKYPDDKICTGIDFLPMLLVVPRFNDYQDGSALLGLGDIVLPGYLIAFCARLDEAKRIVGKHTSKEMEYTDRWYQGYFFWLMISYAIGLALAFLAFGLSGVGQPALLYLVPCCLGMVCLVGRKELKDLWNGARAIRLALKLQTRCEKAWGKEKMRRDVAKAKRLRGEHVNVENTGMQGNGIRRHGGGRGDSQGKRNNQGGRGHGGRRTSAPSLQGPLRSSANLESSKPKESARRERSRSPGRSSTGINGSPQKGTAKKVVSSPSKLDQVDLEASTEGRKPTDVCFGDTKCTGTKHLRTIIKRELKDDPRVTLNNKTMKSIHQRLGGRAFYVKRQTDDNWELASNDEISAEVSKMFKREKEKLLKKELGASASGKKN